MMRAHRVDPGDEDGVLQTIEQHWAVAAIPPHERRHARELAARLWTTRPRDGAPGRSFDAIVRSPVDQPARLGHASGWRPRLAKREREPLAAVASAYERAALDRVTAVLDRVAVQPATPAALFDVGETDRVEPGLARLMAELRVSTGVAFALRRVLPLPADPDPARRFHVVRVAAMGVLADRQAEVARWTATVASPSSEAHAEDAADLPWDMVLRREVPRIWVMLLGGLTPDRVEAAFEAIGALREARFVREAGYLAGLSAESVQAAHLHLIALYAMADAAATLVLHVRRGARADTAADLAVHFLTMQTVLPGDHEFDRLVPWLALAARMLAARATTQLPLPGLLA